MSKQTVLSIKYNNLENDVSSQSRPTCKPVWLIMLLQLITRDEIGRVFNVILVNPSRYSKSIIKNFSGFNQEYGDLTYRSTYLLA